MSTLQVLIMSSIAAPRIKVLERTNLDQAYQHSILISVLRGLAAFQVVAAHLRAQLFPSLRSLPDPSIWYQALAFFTGFAHQAVVVFFLLSGWLVGGSLLNKLDTPKAMIFYAIDRISRLWIVLVPAFGLTILIASLTESVDPGRVSYSIENEYSVLSFFGNLFGLQDMAVPRFGGNFSLWSLANEIWYYILFPVCIVALLAKSRPHRVAAVSIGLVAAYCLPFQLTLYFLIWLLGVGFSRIRVELSRTPRLLLIAALIALSVNFRLTGSNDILTAESFVQDLVFSIPFLLLLCSLQNPADRTRPGTRLAALIGSALSPFSFTLYVIHVPLLVMLRSMYEPLSRGRLSPANAADFGIYFVMLATIVLLAYLFHLPFEAQTYRLREMIKRTLFGSATRRGAVV